ncbi:MAG: hypothetical protein JNM89_02195 [Hyphomicrobiaceae bacterium]|nr:hypothetical protein [Hyphomicrobiaceae bacterium]
MSEALLPAEIRSSAAAAGLGRRVWEQLYVALTLIRYGASLNTVRLALDVNWRELHANLAVAGRLTITPDNAPRSKRHGSRYGFLYSPRDGVEFPTLGMVQGKLYSGPKW